MEFERGDDGHGSRATLRASRYRHVRGDHWCQDAIPIVLGRFNRVLSIALPVLLRGDQRLRVLDRDLENTALEVALRRWKPRVVILEDTVGPAVAEALQAGHPGTRVLVLALDPTRGHGMRMLGSGFNCVAWNGMDVDFAAAVHLTAQGRRFFVAANGERVERRYPVDAEALTAREKEVLVFLVKAASYSTIAVALGMSVRTAEIHAASVRQKLHVQDKRDLIGLPIPH